MRTFLLVAAGLLSTVFSGQAASITFPAGYVPFTSIYYESGPDQNGYSIVEGVLTTINQNGALYEYLLSLPALSDTQAYTNPSIELAPGLFFSNVLVPTSAKHPRGF